MMDQVNNLVTQVSSNQKICLESGEFFVNRVIAENKMLRASLELIVNEASNVWELDQFSDWVLKYVKEVLV